MVQKYTPPASSSPSTVLTSDMYLAAFLLTRDCRLAKVMKNDRRRVSFLVEGAEAGKLRQRYRRGPVYVNVRFLRENLLTLRRLMDGKNRSNSCPQVPLPLSGSPMRSSAA